MATTHLLYLHGFRSSPQSVKARATEAAVRQQHPTVRWWCPQLPASPRDAMEQVLGGIARWQREPGFVRLAVIGSSLGGFYATAVAEHHRCQAVLLNPAVEPARDLRRHIGELTAWHTPQERFFFEPRFIDELHALQTGALEDPERYLAVIAKGDEVLDWREMAARYQGAHLRLLEGGDHALSDFDAHLPDLLAFLDLA